MGSRDITAAVVKRKKKEKEEEEWTIGWRQWGTIRLRRRRKKRRWGRGVAGEGEGEGGEGDKDDCQVEIGSSHTSSLKRNVHQTSLVLIIHQFFFWRPTVLLVGFHVANHHSTHCNALQRTANILLLTNVYGSPESLRFFKLTWMLKLFCKCRWLLFSFFNMQAVKCVSNAVVFHPHSSSCLSNATVIDIYIYILYMYICIYTIS